MCRRMLDWSAVEEGVEGGLGILMRMCRVAAEKFASGGVEEMVRMETRGRVFLESYGGN